MAEDSHGLGIPLPADSTPIHQYPKIAREMGEAIAKILSGDLMPAGMAVVAAEAVRAMLSEADVLTGGDPRVASFGSSEEVLFVVLDAMRRQTWLGVNTTDGGPTDWAVQLLRKALGVGPAAAPGYLFAVTDDQKRLTDLAIRSSDGQFADFVIERLKTRILGDFIPAAQRTYADAPYSPGSDLFPAKADSMRVASWGSSSTEWGNSEISAPFTARGAAWAGGGKAGEWAEHTAARMGSRPALLTVTGGKIPASGSVTCSASNVPPHSSLKAFTGTLAGVRGTLSADGSRFTFSRSGSGAEITVAPDTAFLSDGIAHRDATSLLWMGKNNLTNNPASAAEVIKITDDAFDWLVPLAKRALVLGHFVNTGAAAGDLSRAPIRAVNAAHRARYGRLFIDVAGYLTGSQIWTDTGITPTAEDRAEQLLGNKPPSLSADAGHLNSAGYAAIARHLIDPRLTELGWY